MTSDDQQPLLPTSNSASNPSSAPSNHPTSALAKHHSQLRHFLRRYLTSKLGHYVVLALVTIDVASIFADLVIQTLRCERHGKAIEGHQYDDALEILGIVSLVISCLFVVELLVSVWAFGFRYVVLDCFLVSTGIYYPLFRNTWIFRWGEVSLLLISCIAISDQSSTASMRS